MNKISFEPPLHQERARTSLMRDELASELGTTLPLPMELLEDVAQRLLREYAVVMNSSFASRNAFESSVTLALPMIGQYIHFQGERYLSSLTNATVRNTAYASPKVIYISEDHLGIRQVVLSDSSVSPIIPCVPGVWWKAILARGDTLTFYSDVRDPSIICH